MIELEQPIQHLIHSLDRSVQLSVNSRRQMDQMAIRAEQRAEYEFSLRFPYANIQYAPFAVDLEIDEEAKEEEKEEEM